MLLVLLDRVQVKCLASRQTLPRRRSCVAARVPEMFRAPAVREPATFHAAVGLHPRAHEEGHAPATVREVAGPLRVRLGRVALAPETVLGLPVLRAEVRSHPERGVERRYAAATSHELAAATLERNRRAPRNATLTWLLYCSASPLPNEASIPSAFSVRTRSTLPLDKSSCVCIAGAFCTETGLPLALRTGRRTDADHQLKFQLAVHSRPHD